MTDHALPARWQRANDHVWEREHQTPDGRVACTVRLSGYGAEGQVFFAKPRNGARSTTRRARSGYHATAIGADADAGNAWALNYCAAWCDGFVDAWLWELRGPSMTRPLRDVAEDAR